MTVMQVATVSKVWEDNNIARKMATDAFPSMTPRTKHIAVECHWFREHLKEGEIEVKRIDTAIQIGQHFHQRIET